MRNSLNDRFRHALRAAMTADKWTSAYLAQRSGYSAGHIDNVLAGRRANPTLQFVECVSVAMGYGPLDLLRETEQ